MTARIRRTATDSTTAGSAAGGRCARGDVTFALSVEDPGTGASYDALSLAPAPRISRYGWSKNRGAVRVDLVADLDRVVSGLLASSVAVLDRHLPHVVP